MAVWRSGGIALTVQNPISYAKNLSDFIKLVKQFHSNRVSMFYRGHKDARYLLQPSVFRKEVCCKHERTIIDEVINRHSDKFLNDTSMLDRLVRMQHYEQPTRLLDVTNNPLFALFFACEAEENMCDCGNSCDAEVILFRVDRDLVKYARSDTVSCITNLALLQWDERSRLRGETVDSFKEAQRNVARDDKSALDFPPNSLEYVILRYLHFIKAEKPYFLPKVDPNDLRKFVFVKSKMNNDRIIAQSGAFIAFGLERIIKDEYDGLKIGRIRIEDKHKPKMINQLEMVGITRGSLFPEIDKSRRDILRRIDSPI